MKKFEAVLFDLDGTLLNTKEFILQAFNHSLRVHGQKTIEWKDIQHLMGKPMDDLYRHVTTFPDLEKLYATHHEFQQKNVHLSSLFDNVRETLSILTQAGCKLGVVTNRGGGVGSSLELAGIDHLLSVIITADDVVNAKPHPEPVFKALQILNVKPKQAVMVGDAEYDILAGKAARTKTIGVTYGFRGADIAKSKPDFLVDTISDILPIILSP